MSSWASQGFRRNLWNFSCSDRELGVSQRLASLLTNANVDVNKYWIDIFQDWVAAIGLTRNESN
jgi:hypothetical protein